MGIAGWFHLSPLPQESLWAAPSSTSMEIAQRKWSVLHNWLLNTSAISGRMWLLICYATGSGATTSWMSPSSPTRSCTRSSGTFINLCWRSPRPHRAHIIFIRCSEVGWPAPWVAWRTQLSVLKLGQPWANWGGHSVGLRKGPHILHTLLICLMNKQRQFTNTTWQMGNK